MAARSGRVRLLLDMGVARRAAPLLKAAGYEVAHVSMTLTPTAPDTAILAWAADHDAIVVSLDSDFAALLARTGADRPSVIHCRIEGLHYRRVAALLERVVPMLEADLAAGCIAAVTPGGIRVRRLPLGRASGAAEA